MRWHVHQLHQIGVETCDLLREQLIQAPRIRSAGVKISLIWLWASLLAANRSIYWAVWAWLQWMHMKPVEKPVQLRCLIDAIVAHMHFFYIWARIKTGDTCDYSCRNLSKLDGSYRKKKRESKNNIYFFQDLHNNVIWYF